MADPISGAALIIALLSGLNSIINTMHLRKVKCGSCQSECSKGNTPPNSPQPEQSKKKGVSFQDKKDNHSSLSV
jgi:hypothetical protein